jgi:hypothetical protein
LNVVVLWHVSQLFDVAKWPWFLGSAPPVGLWQVTQLPTKLVWSGLALVTQVAVVWQSTQSALPALNGGWFAGRTTANWAPVLWQLEHFWPATAV